jgi:hypothetical protein
MLRLGEERPILRDKITLLLLARFARGIFGLRNVVVARTMVPTLGTWSEPRAGDW